MAAPLPNPLGLGSEQLEGLLHNLVTVGDGQTVDGHHGLVLQPGCSLGGYLGSLQGALP